MSAPDSGTRQRSSAGDADGARAAAGRTTAVPVGDAIAHAVAAATPPAGEPARGSAGGSDARPRRHARALVVGRRREPAAVAGHLPGFLSGGGRDDSKASESKPEPPAPAEEPEAPPESGSRRRTFSAKFRRLTGGGPGGLGTPLAAAAAARGDANERGGVGRRRRRLRLGRATTDPEKASPNPWRASTPVASEAAAAAHEPMLTARIVWGGRRRRRSLTRCTRTALSAVAAPRLMAGVLEYGTATAETLEALSAEPPPPPPFEPGPASVVVWVDHASVWLPVEQHAAEGAHDGATLQSLLLRADLLDRGSPQEMIVEADAKQLGAHAVVVSDSGHSLTAQLADGLPFLEPTRLIAKVTSATPPEVRGRRFGGVVGGRHGGLGGRRRRTRRICSSAPSLCASTSTRSTCESARRRRRRSPTRRRPRRRRRRGRARPTSRVGTRRSPSLRAVRRCGARVARCPARR